MRLSTIDHHPERLVPVATTLLGPDSAPVTGDQLLVPGRPDPLLPLVLTERRAQTEFHGSLALAAVIGLLYLTLPRKAKITLEWER